MTHADLVQRAVRWLANTRRCQLVCTRQLLVANEQPDAIGWTAGGASVLVECKVSRSDYKADLLKPHRLHPSLGMGNERYYLTPGNLLDASQIPSPWGLLECWQHRIVPRRAAVFVPEKNWLEELKHAVACAVRGVQEFEVEIMAGCVPDVGL